MGSYFDILTRASELAPHGYCLLWQPELIWTHVIADALIAAAYFSIPIAILRFVTGRPDIEFSWIFWLFALFIIACGTTHLMAIWTLWNPDYGWEALIKLITAIASVGTAIVLWPLIPRALAIPSPLQLRQANAELSQRVRERDDALDRLKREIEDRQRAEAALAQAQKMDAVGQLTGGIAHDFNNLLAVVIGNLDMIGRKTDDERTRRLAGNALQAAERGAKVTGQLLAFSRTQRLEVRPTEVRSLVEGLTDLIRQTVGPAVQLDVDVAEAGVAVLADPNQLELALLNLAIKRRDAMPGGGTLRLAARPVDIRTIRTWPTATMSSSACMTRAPAWRRKSPNGHSIRSSPPRTWGRGPVWGCRWSMASPSNRAASPGSAARLAKERPSRSSCQGLTTCWPIGARLPGWKAWRRCRTHRSWSWMMSRKSGTSSPQP
jgi:signal transduction histidine kinase